MAGADIRSTGDGEQARHDPTAAENASFVLTWNVSDELTRIEKTVGEKTFRKDLTWVAGNPTIITDWVEV